MEKNIYRIKFITKKGCIKKWVIDIEEESKKRAIAYAKELWYKHHSAHTFNIDGRKLLDSEELKFNYFMDESLIDMK